jgi:hypothetical protein
MLCYIDLEILPIKCFTMDNVRTGTLAVNREEGSRFGVVGFRAESLCAQVMPSMLGGIESLLKPIYYPHLLSPAFAPN